MKNKISELMDGELANQDAKKIIETLKKEDNLQHDWNTYHLIGDILRKQTSVSTDITQRVRYQLKSEPIIFKPNKSAFGNSKIKVFSFATAASIVAMVTAWFMMQDVYQQSHPITMVDQSKIQTETIKPVTPVLVSHPQSLRSYPRMVSEDMNNYLFFHNFHNYHKDFPAGTTAHGQSVYVYPVTDFHDKYGQ
ncbi:MAG: sigma-E factor negative regulatory protein [Burkholderiales bacterium]|nr:sigma-E factor negative regulatory protein [Nitrosomonas sp.]MCP5273638.1 sigma-E factor negative regulatory protein [Burkholderiales bacterium]